MLTKGFSDLLLFSSHLYISELLRTLLSGLFDLNMLSVRWRMGERTDCIQRKKRGGRTHTRTDILFYYYISYFSADDLTALKAERKNRIDLTVIFTEGKIL